MQQAVDWSIPQLHILNCEYVALVNQMSSGIFVGQTRNIYYITFEAAVTMVTGGVLVWVKVIGKGRLFTDTHTHSVDIPLLCRPVSSSQAGFIHVEHDWMFVVHFLF